MKRYTPEELAEVIRLHGLWRRGEVGGVRAYLDGANLDGAYLDGANLDGANLDGANLAGANLDGANLVRANLDGANLVRANLAGANLAGANLAGAYLDGANLDGAYLDGANLAGAYLDGAYLDGANLDGAYLAGANLDGANLDGVEIAYLSAFSGLYEYQCQAVASIDGTPWVRMGCLWKTVNQWDSIGIRNSNKHEFPDDGSEKCERRVRAFEFTRIEAIRLAEKVRSQPPRVATPKPEPPFERGMRVQLSKDGRERWPWAPTETGEVCWCRGGWTRVEFETCFISLPDTFIELSAAAAVDEEISA